MRYQWSWKRILLFTYFYLFFTSIDFLLLAKSHDSWSEGKLPTLHFHFLLNLLVNILKLLKLFTIIWFWWSKHKLNMHTYIYNWIYIIIMHIYNDIYNIYVNNNIIYNIICTYIYTYLFWNVFKTGSLLTRLNLYPLTLNIHKLCIYITYILYIYKYIYLYIHKLYVQLLHNMPI